MTNANLAKSSPNRIVTQHNYNLRSWQTITKGRDSEIHDQRPNQTITSKLKRHKKRRFGVELTWENKMFGSIWITPQQSQSEPLFEGVEAI